MCSTVQLLLSINLSGEQQSLIWENGHEREDGEPADRNDAEPDEEDSLRAQLLHVGAHPGGRGDHRGLGDDDARGGKRDT